MIVDSKTNEVVKDYTIEQLEDEARKMRAWNLVSLNFAGSGHSGGTLGVMDISCALYLKALNHDPKNPSWNERDRLFWSAGHKAPAIYVSLAWSGYFDKEETLKLRKLLSPCEGHPNALKLKGLESSSGSLGQGLSIAVGSALNGKIDKKDYKVYCIMSDGEQQEGQIWEAVLEAAHHKLDNLIAFVDDNGLQIDGHTDDIMKVRPLKEKYEAFGWNVYEVDGHNIKEILDAIETAKKFKGKPSVIICVTVKGKGVSFMEDVCGWHGKPPKRDELILALKELKSDLNVEELEKIPLAHQKMVDEKLEKDMPKFSKDYWWNKQDKMKVEMNPTRMGFGYSLDKNGDDERIVCLGADISGSIRISGFHENHPERKNRWFEMGICEQSGTCVAAGLAKEGRIGVFGTYAVFAAGRALDQLRTTVCYNNYNVKIGGAHGGISVGPDGATHQALEEFFQICGLPNMHMAAGCDSVETERLTTKMLFDINGPCYLRFAREKTPIVTNEKTVLEWGKANAIVYKGEKDNFIDAFEVSLSENYEGDEDIAIISNGPELAECMRAAWILKEEYDIKARVVNMHTMKPFDKEACRKVSLDCGNVLTVEEHQVGGLGNYVASAIMTGNLGEFVKFDMMGVQDTFGLSGNSWELIKYFGLSAEYIAKKVKEMLGK